MADLYERASTEVSAIVPEIWSKRYYDVLLAELPFASLIDKSYEGDIRALGDTVNINTVPEFSDATDLVNEEDKNDADAVTVTQQQLVINKQTVKDFILTDRAMLQSLPIMDKLRELAIYSIQKKIQADIIAATVPAVANQLSYTAPGVLDLVDMLAAKEKMDEADVPMSDRHSVLGAGPLNDIFNITGFTSSDFLTQAAGSPLQSGMVSAPLLGFSINFTSAAAAVSYFFHRSYQTMAAQKGITVKEYDLGVTGVRASRVNVDTLWGLKQLDDLRVVTIS